MGSICGYPLIDRSNVKFFSDEHNIGFNEGVFSDGRPFRLECWAIDQITNITIFISTMGMEQFSSEEVMAFLEKEKLFKVLPGGYIGKALKFTDKNGYKFWSANLVIGDDESTYATSDIHLKPFASNNQPENKQILEQNDAIYTKIKENNDFKDYQLHYSDNDGQHQLHIRGRVLAHCQWTDKTVSSQSLIAILEDRQYLYFYVNCKSKKGFTRFYNSFEEVKNDGDIDFLLIAKAEETIEWYPL